MTHAALRDRVARLCWTGDREPIGRLLAAGALVWLAYAALWLALDGPVLDESGVAAPIIAGDVVYPPGHPNAVVYRRAPILLYQLAALEWRVVPDAWVVSTPRNLLFLFLSTFVPFAVTLACTRRPAWGHVAAALATSETACSLVGVYLMWIFPGVYSTGHIGIHVTVLAIVLLAARVERLGAFLAGLLPVVHAPMVVVAWPTLAGLLAWRRPRRPRAVALAGAAGLAIVGLVALAIARRAAADVPVAPYVPSSDGDVVLRTYVATTDPHRQPFPVRSPIGLVAPAALAGLAAIVLARGGPSARGGPPARGGPRGGRRVAVAVVALAGVAFAAVYGTRAVQAVTGALPPSVLALMPGRYANVAVLVLLPLAVTSLATAAPGGTATMLATALLVLQSVLAFLARQTAFAHLLYGILGAAIGSALGSRAHRTVGLVAGVVLVAAIGAVGGPDAGARLAWLGLPLALAAVAARALGAAPPGRVAQSALAAACVVAALASLRGPHIPNEWEAGSERMSADERGLATWLAANAAPGDMLVAPLFPPSWLQPKTGHPVLEDTMTLANMAYFPETASASARIVRDLFGIDYADPASIRALRGPDGMLRPTSPAWVAAWQARDCAGWRTLGERYGFHWVWADRAHPVRLPVAWTGARWALHRVPPSCDADRASG